MTESATVSDIMTREMVSCSPDDNLEDVAAMFEKYNFDGFPVISKERKLLGLITAYDMILQSTRMHLPVIFGIMKQMQQSQTNGNPLEAHFEKLRKVTIKEIMNIDPLVVGPAVKVEELAKEFVQHHRVNPVPVIDINQNLLGVVSRFDVIRFFNEQYVGSVLKDIDHNGILRRLSRLNEEQDAK